MSVIETLHEMYISLTALLFDIALCAVVIMQGGARKNNKSMFFSAALTVTLSVFLTCLNYFLRHANVGTPVVVALFLHLAAYMGNIFVTYYLVSYLSTFFSSDVLGKRLRIFNKGLLVASGVILLVYFFFQLPHIGDPDVDTFAHGWFRALVGYVIELYYMLLCLTFVRKGNELNLRARITIVVAFAISVITFAMQAVLGSKPLVNYLGVSIGLLIFYFSAETPDYLKLQDAMKELEEEKRTAEEAKLQADAANRSKSDFLANMSHEIRTPINAVLGMNEMIRREGVNPNVLTYAHNIESAGKNLLSIINDILDFSKIEAGRMEIINAPYSLSEVLNDVCNMIDFRAKNKHLTFEADIEPSLPDRLTGDEVRVRQVITNLLTNAVKYTDEGGFSLRVTGTCKNSTCELVISVRDSGIGIREEDRVKLFSKFERVDMEHNKTVEGTGLGLAITGNLVRLMGGTIAVESVYGEGSTFTVTLPQEIVSAEPIGDFRERLRQSEEAEEGYRETFRAPGARVLVADDTPMNLTVIEGLLKQTMVILELASGGQQALTLARDTQYDLIFMDQRMPGMDGTEALQRIRDQESGKNHSTPVICLTADAVQGARERYIEEGFTDYLSKPVEGAALERILMRYLPPEKVIRMRSSVAESAAAEAAAQMTEAGALAQDPASSALAQGAAGICRGASLNYDEAKKYLATDELIEKTLRQFYESAAGNAEEIEHLLAEGDLENYTVKVHALKSSARLIGAEALSKAAEHLEMCGNTALSQE